MIVGSISRRSVIPAPSSYCTLIEIVYHFFAFRFERDAITRASCSLVGFFAYPEISSSYLVLNPKSSKPFSFVIDVLYKNIS